jgi:hypothetical protein
MAGRVCITENRLLGWYADLKTFGLPTLRPQRLCHSYSRAISKQETLRLFPHLSLNAGPPWEQRLEGSQPPT